MADVYTVGHSNLSSEALLELLRLHSISAVADVRSHPFSRRLPHFNKEFLKRSLNDAGIHYVFLGQELGARPTDPGCYDLNGTALYERIAATDLFQAGIQRVLQGSATHRIALMCAEKDPLTCHRAILVCRCLQQQGARIHHILSDGLLESQPELEGRLFNKFNGHLEANTTDQLSLFSGILHSETPLTLEEAYARHGRAIAYTNPELSPPT